MPEASSAAAAAVAAVAAVDDDDDDDDDDDEVSQSHSPEVRTRATSSSRYVPAAGSPADHAESDRAASYRGRLHVSLIPY